jgi:isoleucyl-tRNA synthetase
LHSIIIRLKTKNCSRKQFPADFISEAVDQTRGWFYSLLAISTLIFNKAPYKNVIVLGHVQDENGQKMSKSKGNAVDPMEALKSTAPTPSAGISTSTPLRGCRTVSTTRRSRKDSGSSWERCGIPMPSLCFMRISIISMRRSITLEYDKLPVMDKWLLSKLNTTDEGSRYDI